MIINQNIIQIYSLEDTDYDCSNLSHTNQIRIHISQHTSIICWCSVSSQEYQATSPQLLSRNKVELNEFKYNRCCIKKKLLDNTGYIFGYICFYYYLKELLTIWLKDFLVLDCGSFLIYYFIINIFDNVFRHCTRPLCLTHYCAQTSNNFKL